MGQAAAVSHFVVVVCLLTKQYYFHIYRWFASTWPGTLLLDNKVTKHGAEQEGTFWQCYVTFVHGVLLIMGFNAKSNSSPNVQTTHIQNGRLQVRWIAFPQHVRILGVGWGRGGFDESFPACTFFKAENDLHAPIPLLKPESGQSDSTSWDDCRQVFKKQLCVSLFSWEVPTLCLDSTVSSLQLRWVEGVYCVLLYSYNFPPALTAEWPVFYMPPLQ